MCYLFFFLVASNGSIVRVPYVNPSQCKSFEDRAPYIWSTDTRSSMITCPFRIFCALLALCAGNSPVTAEFPSQRPVTLSCDVFFDVRPHKRLSKQSWGWWFETPSCSLWRHCNANELQYRDLTWIKGNRDNNNGCMATCSIDGFPAWMASNAESVSIWWRHHALRCSGTVYPKKYAHGFCFATLCCGYTLTDFPISIRLTSLALWQSNDCPSASKATLMNMDKYFMWIHYERLHNHNKTKHNKTVCIFLGIYCMSCLHPENSRNYQQSKCSVVSLHVVGHFVSSLIT